jgi:hypothetical protein
LSGDTLSDLLRTVRPRGAVFYYVESSSPWVAQAPPAAEIFPAIVRDPIVGCAPVAPAREGGGALDP